MQRQIAVNLQVLCRATSNYQSIAEVQQYHKRSNTDVHLVPVYSWYLVNLAMVECSGLLLCAITSCGMHCGDALVDRWRILLDIAGAPATWGSVVLSRKQR